MIIQRGIEKSGVRLLKEGQDVTLEESDIFFDRFPTINIIRIRSDEYGSLPEVGALFTHFNLQASHHKAGEIYILPKIVEGGYFDGKEEVLPLLSFEGIDYGVCTEVKDCLEYSNLTRDDFDYSFPHIKTVGELKEAIVKRYSQSMPHLTAEKILELGISKTTLRLLGKIS